MRGSICFCLFTVLVGCPPAELSVDKDDKDYDLSFPDTDNRPDDTDPPDTDPVDTDNPSDTDDEGVGNNADEDDDNDGISDEEELDWGVDCLRSEPLHPDTDDDGILDGQDAYPRDPFPEFLLRRNDLGSIDLYLSNRDGTFRDVVEIGEPIFDANDQPLFYQFFSIGDFNADGRVDFVAHSSPLVDGEPTRHFYYFQRNEKEDEFEQTYIGDTDAILTGALTDANDDLKFDIVTFTQVAAHASVSYHGVVSAWAAFNSTSAGDTEHDENASNSLSTGSLSTTGGNATITDIDVSATSAGETYELSRADSTQDTSASSALESGDSLSTSGVTVSDVVVSDAEGGAIYTFSDGSSVQDSSASGSLTEGATLNTTGGTATIGAIDVDDASSSAAFTLVAGSTLFDTTNSTLTDGLALSGSSGGSGSVTDIDVVDAAGNDTFVITAEAVSADSDASHVNAGDTLSTDGTATVSNVDVSNAEGAATYTFAAADNTVASTTGNVSRERSAACSYRCSAASK